MKKALEYRMYGFVPYNLSDIQKGIQFGHAVVEYQLGYGNTKEYKQWAKHNKTFIILNGGTSNDGERSYYNAPKELGSMENIKAYLKSMPGSGMDSAYFYEPDLNYMLSGIAFLVDERVWDKEKYPATCGPKDGRAPDWWDITADDLEYKKQWRVDYKKEYTNWLKSIGGRQNEILRTYLRNFKLA